MEMVIIAVVALVVLGPEKFPMFAKVAMRTFRDLTNYYNDAKRDIVSELNPVKKEFQTLSRYKPEEYIERLANSISDDVKEAVKEDDVATQASPAPEGTLSRDPAYQGVPGAYPAGSSTPINDSPQNTD